MALSTIALDRVELIFDGFEFDNSICNEDAITLKLNPDAVSPNYKKCYSCLYENRLFGKLFTESRGKYRYEIPNPILFIIENSMLYEGGLQTKLNKLMRAINVKFYKFKQVDIAIDGYDYVSLHDRFMKDGIFKRRQRLLTDIKVSIDDKTKQPTGYILGSKFSNKHIVIYNKQSDAFTPEKDYISEFWRINGLVPLSGKTICRIEVRLKKTNLGMFNANFKVFDSTSFLRGVFKKEAENYLEFLTPNKESSHIIDWNDFNTTLSGKSPLIVSKKGASSFKTVIKRLYLEFTLTKLLFYKKSYIELTAKYGLNSWFLLKKDTWRL